jgi:hypothetical protein
MWQEQQRTTPWQQSQEQQHSVIQPPIPVPQPGMGWLPLAANDRTGFGGIVISLFLFPLIFVPQGIANFVGSHLPLFPRLGALLFFFLFPGFVLALGVAVHKQARRWNMINQRRQIAAFMGFTPDVPLAEPQPVPNLGALPLYSTIKLKVNLVSSLVWACLMTCIPFLIWTWMILSFTLQYGDPLKRSLETSLPDWSSFLGLIGFVMFFVIRASKPQQIEITPEGLTVKHSGYQRGKNWLNKQQTIRWHEARLFAIRDGKPGGSRVRYELSGPFTVVTFERILRPGFWSRFRPAPSFGEYSMQMDALLALIAANTGLLLYDVRQHD